MTDRIDSVITELSSAADLLIAAESVRSKAAEDPTAVTAADAKFLADFSPENCGHLAELIRELRDYCRSQHPCP